MTLVTDTHAKIGVYGENYKCFTYARFKRNPYFFRHSSVLVTLRTVTTFCLVVLF